MSLVLEEPQVAAGEDAQPACLPLSVIGTPETLCCSMTSRARATVASGGSVTGSVMMPLARPLDLVDLLGLPLDRHVLVDDAQAALLGQGDGHLALGDRVHRRAEQGDVQPDALGEPRPHVALGGHDVAIARLEQHVVEGDSLVAMRSCMLRVRGSGSYGEQK